MGNTFIQKCKLCNEEVSTWRTLKTYEINKKDRMNYYDNFYETESELIEKIPFLRLYGGNAIYQINGVIPFDCYGCDSCVSRNNDKITFLNLGGKHKPDGYDKVLCYGKSIVDGDKREFGLNTKLTY